jgi:hypothetical protein
VAERATRNPSRARASLSAGVAVLFLLLAACSGQSSSSGTDANQTFLSEVHDQAPDVSEYRTDVQLVRLGHAACEGFSSGASYVQLADRLALQEGSDLLPPADLGAVISSAVREFCPRYDPLVS